MQNDNDLNIFREEISKAGMRMSVAKIEVFKALKASDRPLQLTEIVDKASNVHYVNVYRTIDAFLKIGVIKQIPQGFKNAFELSDKYIAHHHHATCDKCGNIEEINNEKVEAIIHQISDEINFSPNKHHFEIYGVCSKCASR